MADSIELQVLDEFEKVIELAQTAINVPNVVAPLRAVNRQEGETGLLRVKMPFANVWPILDTGQVGSPGNRATPLNHMGNDLEILTEVWYKWQRKNLSDIMNMKASLIFLIKNETNDPPGYTLQTGLKALVKRVRIGACQYVGDLKQTSLGFHLTCFAQYRFQTIDPFTI
jgi:hypothetical protein